MMKRMTFVRTPRFLMAVAWLLHVVAWFLPVYAGTYPLPKWLPGWEAFNVALSAFYDYGHPKPWYAVVIGALSALSTILFIVGSPWVALRGSRRLRLVSAWAASVAFVNNTTWYLLSNDRAELRAGYFLWCLSFAVLAVALFRFAKETTDERAARAFGP